MFHSFLFALTITYSNLYCLKKIHTLNMLFLVISFLFFFFLYIYNIETKKNINLIFFLNLWFLSSLKYIYCKLLCECICTEIVHIVLLHSKIYYTITQKKLYCYYSILLALYCRKVDEESNYYSRQLFMDMFDKNHNLISDLIIDKAMQKFYYNQYTSF